MTRLIADLLRDRVRTGGAGPLVTYYDGSWDQRVELSGTTFANWVAKTANLLESEFAVGPGDRVALPLAVTDPGHWVTAVWEVACWQVGGCVVPGADPSASALVCGPDWRAYELSAAEVVSCSLHPLAMGLGRSVPENVTDYDVAVRGQPDVHSAPTVPTDAPAWRDGGTLSQADLVRGADGPALRRLVEATTAWATAQQGILTALVTGGSYVVVTAAGPDRLAEIRATERVSTNGP